MWPWQISPLTYIGKVQWYGSANLFNSRGALIETGLHTELLCHKIPKVIYQLLQAEPNIDQFEKLLWLWMPWCHLVANVDTTEQVPYHLVKS